MKRAYIDFEFRRTAEAQLDLVACVVKGPYKTGLKFWLWNNKAQQNKLAKLLTSIKKTHVLVSFGAGAEARAMLALGLNPWEWEWYCLYLDHRAMRNQNDSTSYGRVLVGGKEVISTPPYREGPSDQVGDSLADALYYYEGIDLDSEHKNEMRDLILYSDFFGPEDIKKILLYCAMDVEYLPVLDQHLETSLGKFAEHQYRTARGNWAANLGVVEAVGIPLNMERVHALSLNHGQIKDELIEHCNGYWPFFLWNKKEQRWVQAYDQFAGFVERKRLGAVWPKTDGGKTGKKKFKSDEKTLDKYRGLEEIEVLYQTRKSLNNIKWFRPAALPEFLAAVGEDGRLRPWYGPCGTLTSRNAPPAKRFVFAMSNWLRCLIEAAPGNSITGLDWKSQEFAIAAALSKDRKMLEAYNSGDPYMYFCIAAGGAKKGSTKETAPKAREKFKSTVLGMQYQMGTESLAIKLTQDTKEFHAPEDAQELVNLHKETFEDYWHWLDKVLRHYRKKNPLHTRDGWPMWCDNRNERSAGNFPVQGNGAAILRRAVQLCHEKGVRVVATLHDAIYIEHRSTDKRMIETAKQCMTQAVNEVLRGAVDIGIDSKTIHHGQVWVEDKGREFYLKMEKWLSDPIAALI